MPTPLAIVTAVDAAYFRLFQGLVGSLAHAGVDDATLCVIDVGLAPDQRAWALAQGARVEEGRWDVDFPRRDERRRSFQAVVCRPFLPRYFPGHETYLWADADTWVQDKDALALLAAAAADGSVAVVPEIDRAYRIHYDLGHVRKWMYRAYRRCFGTEVADLLWWNPMVNAGVYALRGDSACWSAWAEHLIEGLVAVGRADEAVTDDDWGVDQVSLMYGIYTESLPAHFLPSRCNWMLSHAVPLFDPEGGRFLHPRLPHEPLGLLHLAGVSPKRGPAELCTTGGETVSRWLTWSGEPA
jgi:hypothetical protein